MQGGSKVLVAAFKIYTLDWLRHGFEVAWAWLGKHPPGADEHSVLSYAIPTSVSR